MNTPERVVAILARRSGIKPDQIRPDHRLVEDLRLDGDDAVDTLLEIARLFDVDLSGFDSARFFHSEPTLLTLLPFLPSTRRAALPKSPITVQALIEAVQNRSFQF